MKKTLLLDRTLLADARSAFVAVADPNLPDAERRSAILALRAPPAVKHLAGMLSQYDWDFIEQAKEIRGYVVAQLLEETKNPHPRTRLRALELVGKLTEVGSFTERSEVRHITVSADDLEERIRAKLSKYLPPQEAVTDAIPKELT